MGSSPKILIYSSLGVETSSSRWTAMESAARFEGTRLALETVLAAEEANFDSMDGEIESFDTWL